MAVNVGWTTRPHPGESECGDCCGWWAASGRTVLALADGLGHGAAAAAAAESAMAAIAANLDRSCEDVFALCNESLSATRGAALAVAIVEPEAGRLVLGSVGNIRAQLLTATRDIRLGGARGIVGAGYANLAPETVALSRGDILVLFSDGLDEFAALRDMLERPGVPLQAQAQALLERWASPDDDAAVLVYRHET